MNTGKIIKTLRTSAGLNQKQLAALLGISPSSLSLIENGEREPNLRLLKSLGRVFGIPVSVLFFEAGDVPEGLTQTQSENYTRVQSLMIDVLSATMFESAKANSSDRKLDG